MSTRIVELARNGAVSVSKKYGMSVQEFRREHLHPGVPVVIGDATADWPARTKFTPEFFRTHYGAQPIHLDDGRSFALAELLDMLMTATAERPAPYPCKLRLDGSLPELLADVTPRYAFALPDRIHSRLMPQRFLGGADTFEIFFGSPGGQFPYMHYDYMGLHAFINQLYGDKEFTVIPPGQTDYVYPDPDNPWKSLVADHRHPDRAAFPRFARATPVSFVVGAGETLFIPNGWWHTALSRTVTISVAFDLLNASNWQRFEAEVRGMMRPTNPFKRALINAYLGCVGGLLSVGERVGVRI